MATLGIPGSAGVPEEFVGCAGCYNDLDAVEQAFKKFAGKIACVIVEPVVGNMGCVPPRDGYLAGLRAITEREGALLILDEVMTGFRVAYGGAAELYGVKADLVTLGKIIGGGLPVGAYGGAAKIMDMVAPVGPVYQAGTLSGNPLAMAAGITTLCELRDNRERLYKQLDENSAALVAGVLQAAREVLTPTLSPTEGDRMGHPAGVPMTANRVGSMFTFCFTDKQVTDWESVLVTLPASADFTTRCCMQECGYLHHSSRQHS